MSQRIQRNIASVSNENSFFIEITFINKLSESSLFIQLWTGLCNDGMKSVIANVIKGIYMHLKKVIVTPGLFDTVDFIFSISWKIDIRAINSH